MLEIITFIKLEKNALKKSGARGDWGAQKKKPIFIN